MLTQNFGVTNKEHYGMLWCFMEWSIQYILPIIQNTRFIVNRVNKLAT